MTQCEYPWKKQLILHQKNKHHRWHISAGLKRGRLADCATHHTRNKGKIKGKLPVKRSYFKFDNHCPELLIIKLTLSKIYDWQWNVYEISHKNM
jgi:hypothetical protein